MLHHRYRFSFFGSDPADTDTWYQYRCIRTCQCLYAIICAIVYSVLGWVDRKAKHVYYSAWLEGISPLAQPFKCQLEWWRFQANLTEQEDDSLNPTYGDRWV